MEILIRLDVTDEKFSKKIFEHLESIEKMNIQYSIKCFNENEVRTNGLIINEGNSWRNMSTKRSCGIL